MSAFLWDWSTTSSCPPSATTPPKNWALSLPRRPKKRQESSKGWGSGTFAGLLFSNLMSLLLGAGLGVWIYRRCFQTYRMVFLIVLMLLRQWQNVRLSHCMQISSTSPDPFCAANISFCPDCMFVKAFGVSGMCEQITDILPYVHVLPHLSCFYAMYNVEKSNKFKNLNVLMSNCAYVIHHPSGQRMKKPLFRTTRTIEVVIWPHRGPVQPLWCQQWFKLAFLRSIQDSWFQIQGQPLWCQPWFKLAFLRSTQESLMSNSSATTVVSTEIWNCILKKHKRLLMSNSSL